LIKIRNNAILEERGFLTLLDIKVKEVGKVSKWKK